MKNDIIHNGIIERIEYPFIFVRIIQQSACSGCHAKSACTAADSQIKTIEIEDYSGNFQINEEVNICGKYTTGLKAVLLAFIIPLALMVSSLIIGGFFTKNEIIIGAISLISLLFYYIAIYLIRNKLKKKFIFSLSKIN